MNAKIAERCFPCNGRGWVVEFRKDDDLRVACRHCAGTGERACKDADSLYPGQLIPVPRLRK